MHIKSIDQDATTPRQAAFRTDTLLTEEIYKDFITNLRKTTLEFALLHGLLLIRPPEVTADIIDQINEQLTASADRVQAQKEAAEQERNEHLNALSEATGLPVE